MNIFILNSGRCGSTTFIKACGHITNYTCGHETRVPLIGEQRLAYPVNHIEADNRLSWLLGRLDRAYGDKAFYVHLSRDRQQAADSFVRRMDFGIMKAYKDGILLGGREDPSDRDLALDYLDTIEVNIELFLKDKTNKMQFRLENAKQDFETFWECINAEGDIKRAMMEWEVSYNATPG